MAKSLRCGRPKNTLESAIDSALLAVEIYNKPRIQFRSQAYVTLMIIAWTKLFHAYFLRNIGDKYYYKERGKKYAMVDGERKAWELKTCIEKYHNLPKPVAKNIEFFIKLRNKIEHRHIDQDEVDIKIFGECQSLLFNFESFLIDNFGEQYALSQNLVYSIQFSHLRSKGQIQANKSALASDVSHVIWFIDSFRKDIPDDVYASQEYSIKLIQIPKVSNTNKYDAAIDFVHLDSLSEDDRNFYAKVTTLIKDRKVPTEGRNVGKLKPSIVVSRVNEILGPKTIDCSKHARYYTVFGIRPKRGAEDPFDTNTKYCHYDEPHNDYLYKESWVEFLVNVIKNDKMGIEKIAAAYKNMRKLDPKDFMVEE